MPGTLLHLAAVATGGRPAVAAGQWPTIADAQWPAVAAARRPEIADAPLQLWDPGEPADWLVTFVQATDLLSALLGLFVAYLAYRGYRRNDSRPMLFVAAGFALALGVPFGLLLVAGLLPVPQAPLAVATQLSQLLGLASICYGLYAPE